MAVRDRLNVVVATHARAENSVSRLHRSICSRLSGWEVATEILIFDAPKKQAQKSNLLPGMRVFHSTPQRLPIVDSRNLCQRHLRELMGREGGHGLILDDDLVWTISQGEFSAHIHRLRELGADMAFLGLAGDPPIPKEYTRACPLLDALLALRERVPFHQRLKCFLDGVTLGHNEVEHTHHDLHAFKPWNYRPHAFRFELSDFIDRLSLGQATTRLPANPSQIIEATGRERGGATLIMNPDVLSVENQAHRIGGIVSRRSDMIMAMSAKSLGFRLFATPAMLNHHRQPAHDTIGPNKLVGDILGYAFLEKIQQQATWQSAFAQRLEKTTWLLLQTSDMLHLLRDVARPDAESCRSINEILKDNARTIKVLNRFSAQSPFTDEAMTLYEPPEISYRGIRKTAELSSPCIA